MTRMQLLSNQVCVWMQNIQAVDDQMLEKQRQCLSVDEEKRAARFVYHEDAKRLILAYSGLRLLLSKYLSMPADSFKFEQNDHGKPYLANSPICFNLSHAKDWIAWAFALNNELGIDIEYEKKNIEILALAKRFFAKEEYVSLKNTAPKNQLCAFYRCWTRKEALIKAIGQGLSHPLNTFVVSLKQEIIDLQIQVKNKSIFQKWHLYSLKMPKKYTAALALEKRVEQIQYNKYKI